MGQLQPQVLERISGPAWDQIRETFLMVNDALLSVSQAACGQLTTIYVKYTGSPEYPEPYAVVWIKTSKQLVVGLALPESFEDSLLGGPLPGTKYKGLTRYFALRPGETVPTHIARWANVAYENVVNNKVIRSSDHISYTDD